MQSLAIQCIFYPYYRITRELVMVYLICSRLHEDLILFGFKRRLLSAGATEQGPSPCTQLPSILGLIVNMFSTPCPCLGIGKIYRAPMSENLIYQFLRLARLYQIFMVPFCPLCFNSTHVMLTYFLFICPFLFKSLG